MLNVTCIRFTCVNKLQKKYSKRTNVYLIDEQLWAWAQYKAKLLGYNSVSEYIFKLIKQDKEKEIIKTG